MFVIKYKATTVIPIIRGKPCLIFKVSVEFYPPVYPVTVPVRASYRSRAGLGSERRSRADNRDGVFTSQSEEICAQRTECPSNNSPVSSDLVTDSVEAVSSDSEI